MASSRPSRVATSIGSVAILVLMAGLSASAAGAAERSLRLGARLQAVLDPQRQRAVSAPAQAEKARPGWLVLPVLLAPGEALQEVHGCVPLRVLGSSAYHGYAIAQVGIAAPDAQQLAGTTVSLVTRVATDLAPAPQRASAARLQAWREEVARLVVNPEELAAYAPPPAFAPTLADFVPSTKPSLEGSPVEMLVVTRESLKSAFEVYASERSQAGVPTVVRTVEWIEANYPHGADRQETIRLFLREAAALWDLHAVLLGGDTDLVPTRYVLSSFLQPPAEVPTDLYYACLDGNWNGDGDAAWGEAYDPFGDPGDGADLYPELYIGRLPVHTVNEVVQYRAKFAAYTNPASVDYQDKLLFLSEVLWPEDYTPGDPIFKNGADNAERLIALNDLDTGNPAGGICPFEIARMYQDSGGYSGTGPLTRQAAIDSMNAGFGIVTHIGHGFRYTMSLGDASLTNVQAASLTNSQRPFFLVMLNCTSSAFDFPCLAEQFLLNPQGGAVGVLGAAREAVPDGSQLYLEAWFRSLFDSDRVSVGLALHEARLEMLADASVEGVLRWTNFITTYLGDPTLSPWRCAPRTASVSHATGLVPGSHQLAVQVSSNAGPAAGATVCLWKAGDFYATARANTSGVATLAFRAEAPGDATLTVQGASLSRHQETVAFGTGTGPILRATGTTVVTDSGPGTVGNGNGVLEAGEQARVAFEVRNSGTATATNIQVGASTNDPFVIIQNPFVDIASLPAGQSVLAPPIPITLASKLPDAHHVELQVSLAITGKSWQDRVAFDLLQVQPRLVGLTVVDADGNGTPDANEPYTLQVQFKNYGFAQLDAATAVLSSTDPDVTITNGNAVVGNIVRLATATAAFQLKETSVAAPNMLHVVLTSGSRSFPFDVETRRPSPPSALTADASTGPDRVTLTWSPSPSADVVGYHVYRAPAAAGPWTRANTDVVTSGTHFGAEGLSGNTQYFFSAAAVDGSGNESARSNTVAVTTNPIQNSGWPRVLRQWTSCTAVAADVDGDGAREIFVGADRVYGWHPNGGEIVDGDANPATDGIFSSVGSGFTAGLAAGDLDGDGKDEIVACSWDTRQVLALDANGSMLPGWPRALVASTFGIWATPTITDLDLDGTPEVLVLGLDGRLYAWHANGTEVRDGDGNAATQGVFFVIPPTATWSRSGPVVANLVTSDATPEIVFATTSNRIYVLRASGTPAPGWPVTVGDDVTSTPAIGDVDGNGALDVVVPAQDGFLYVLRADGTALPGWPQAFSTHWSSLTPSPALHDFDGDGKLEIVVAGSSGSVQNGQITVLNWQGNTLPGWPVDTHTASESSPVLGDLNGDGVVEIVFGGENGLVLGFEPDGSTAPGFPIRLGAEMRGTPTITDVDHDGDTDLVLAGWDQQVYVFDFPGVYRPGLVPWGTFKGNRQRNGAYYPATPTDVDDASIAPARSWLYGNVPNPFNPNTRIDFDIAGVLPQPVRLEIFAASGRRVRTLVAAELGPGRHSRRWDGRDDAGISVPSGVYFMRLLTPALTTSRKLLLLR